METLPLVKCFRFQCFHPLFKMEHLLFPIIHSPNNLYTTYLTGNEFRFTLHYEAGLLPAGSIRVRVKGANITAFISPCHVLDGDFCGVQGGFCEDHSPLVRLIHLLSKPFAVCGQILNGLIFKLPLPRDLKYAWGKTVSKITS